jgi:hypothetical protein
LALKNQENLAFFSKYPIKNNKDNASNNAYVNNANANNNNSKRGGGVYNYNNINTNNYNNYNNKSKYSSNNSVAYLIGKKRQNESYKENELIKPKNYEVNKNDKFKNSGLSKNNNSNNNYTTTNTNNSKNKSKSKNKENIINEITSEDSVKNIKTVKIINNKIHFLVEMEMEMDDVNYNLNNDNDIVIMDLTKNIYNEKNQYQNNKREDVYVQSDILAEIAPIKIIEFYEKKITFI